MKLYYAEVLNPRKACAVAKYLDAPVEYVRIDLATGEQQAPWFVAINPNAKVPVLEAEDKTIWEANAIMCHLARAAGSDLWPNDGERQLEVIRWLSWNADHFSRHAGRLYFEHIIKPHFGIGEPDAAAVEEAQDQVRRFAAVLDAHLRGRRWLLGDTLTIADFAVAVALPYADEARIPIARFTEIERWHAQLDELPAWREPFPARQAAA